MKKYYFIFLLFISVLFISSVKADELSNEVFSFTISDFCQPLGEIEPTCTRSSQTTFFNNNANIILNLYQNLLEEYNSYSSTYSYYRVRFDMSGSLDNPQSLGMTFYLSSLLPSVVSDNYNSPLSYDLSFSQSYDFSSSEYSSIDTTSSGSNNFYYKTDSTSGYLYNYYEYFFSNFDLRVSDISLSGLESIGFDIPSASYQFSNYSNIIPSIYNILELDFLSEYDTNTYTEVNLNNYAYIILSFKSYSELVSPVEFQTIGQSCLTQVNDYGMSYRTSTERCFPFSSSWSTNRIYPQERTLEDKVVYYVVPYNVNQENKIKVNTRVFDITYISQENANNPSVIIGGRSYPVIPFQNLSNTTNDNEESGYIPGMVGNVFDISSDSDFIDTLFQNPLTALGSVWTAIVTMFTLVGSFIALLPTTLQAFLISAFSIGIVLGVLKMLL